MTATNPWRYGNLQESILKAQNIGATAIAKAYRTILEIVRILDAVKDETARREAARKASEDFQKGISNEQQ
jgi:hypothetical protein